MRNYSRIPNRPNVVAPKTDNIPGNHLNQFRAYLEKWKYRPRTVARYVAVIRALGCLMRRQRVVLEDLDEAKALKLIIQARWPTRKRRLGQYTVKHFIRFLIERGMKPSVAPTPEATARQKLRLKYEDYLLHERGLSEKTIRRLWYLIARFLQFRFGDKAAELSKISPLDIARFMQQLHMRRQPYRVKTTATHLRWFFQFLYRAGRTQDNLSLGIPSVAQRWGQRLPRHLLPEQVETLLAAVKSDTPTGRRNYAMLLLMARLGLRPPEVVAMHIDDIDWCAGEIMVRGKGNLFDRVPLSQEVGDALAAYVRQDRATTSGVLFVTERAPYRPFKDSQMINAVIKNAFAKTGIRPPARYVGAHILRHSLATNLVRHGASLEEIANVMRHRSRATTLTYAKLDVEGLRSIALPWPVKGGAK